MRFSISKRLRDLFPSSSKITLRLDKTFGIRSVNGGRGFCLEVEKSVRNRVEFITSEGFEELQQKKFVLAGADACNWHSNPKEAEAKHLTPFAISPNLLRPVEVDGETFVKRVQPGTGMRSPHNNAVCLGARQMV